MDERWSDIPGYEGAYQASSRGRIRSLSRRVQTADGSREWTMTGRVLRAAVGANGYYCVRLSVDGKGRTRPVHRLVAEAFLGEPPRGRRQVLHGNGDPLDNSLSNLRYGSQAENLMDRVAHGTSTRGNCHNAILTDAVIPSIRRAVAAGDPQAVVAERFGVSVSTIAHVIRGDSWHWVKG